jgi:hypothetical protein
VGADGGELSAAEFVLASRGPTALLRGGGGRKDGVRWFDPGWQCLRGWGGACPQWAQSAPPCRRSCLEPPKLRVDKGRTGEKGQNRPGPPPPGAKRALKR